MSSAAPHRPGASGLPGPLDSAGATHTGRVRKANEDRYYVAPEFGVFAVADGMGGHADGALASTTIVDALATIGATVSASDLLARLEDRILRANASLRAIAADRRTVIGSTVAILLVYERDFACVWSGDSRVYRVRPDGIEQLSRDHTEVQDLLERGILSADEARTWPRRHVITRAIGAKDEPELDLDHGRLEPGDTFVICSDGLTGHVEDAEILAHVRRARSAQEICDALVDLTLERGAKDNVTVVAVRVPGQCAGAPQHTAPSTVVVPRGGSPAQPSPSGRRTSDG